MVNKAVLLKEDEEGRNVLRERRTDGDGVFDCMNDAACEMLTMLDGLSYEMAEGILDRAKRLLQASCRVRTEDIPSRHA